MIRIYKIYQDLLYAVEQIGQFFIIVLLGTAYLGVAMSLPGRVQDPCLVYTCIRNAQTIPWPVDRYLSITSNNYTSGWCFKLRGNHALKTLQTRDH